MNIHGVLMSKQQNIMPQGPYNMDMIYSTGSNLSQ